jgi:hypothetical protein
LSSSARHFNLKFFASTDIADKNLQVYLNGQEIGNFEVKTGNFSSFTINNLYFNNGSNVLTFHSDQSWIPAKLDPTSLDTRQLSIAFQNITITE